MTAPADISAYTALLDAKVNGYSNACASFGVPLTDQTAKFVHALLEVVPRYIGLAHVYSTPSRIQSDYQTLFKPIVDCVSSISDVATAVSKDHAQFNKLMSVKSASEALNWIMVSPKPATFVKECSDQSLFYANRVRKDGTDEDKVWVKSMLQLLNGLQEYIQEYHSAGLLWKGSAKPEGTASANDLASILAKVNLGDGDSAAVSVRPAASAGGESDAAATYITEVGGKLDEFVTLSSAFGEDLGNLAKLFSALGKDQVSNYLVLAETHAPPPQSDYATVFADLTKMIGDISQQAEANPRSPEFNKLMTIKSGTEAFTWILASGRPHDFVKECSDQSLFYANRVRKDGGDKEKDWVKCFLQLMTALQSYIKEYHSAGLMWKGKAKIGAGSAGGGAPPPPMAGPPPPPPAGAPPPSSADGASSGGERQTAALFSQLNSGEGVTKGLKKVTADMQTHKNTSLRAASVVPATAAKTAGAADSKSAVKAAVVKPPRMELEMDKKWIIENYKDETLNVEIESMKQSVYMFNCTGTTLVVKGKVNSITLDTCKKCGVVFDDLLASVDLVNSKSIQIQALSKMPLLNIDKTDGAQVYLSKDCLDCEIVSAKSSEMNVLVPQDDGDFAECPIPEQFRTVYNATKKKLVTSCSESLG
jgi:adenylyl cyclase-associated protein